MRKNYCLRGRELWTAEVQYADGHRMFVDPSKELRKHATFGARSASKKNLTLQTRILILAQLEINRSSSRSAYRDIEEQETKIGTIYLTVRSG